MKYFLEKLDYIVVIVTSLLIFLTRFGYSDFDSLHFYTDDFFYYLEIAKKYWVFGFPTFNGVVETNGFHPLYQYLLIFLKSFLSDKSTLLVVGTLQIASAIFTYQLTKSILKKHLSYELAIACSLIIFLQTVLMTKSGMEIIFTIPLMLFAIKLFLEQKKSLLTISLLLSVMTLSRLDSAILSLMLLFVLFKKHNFSFKSALVLSIGQVPFLIYLAHNYIEFSHLTPVSGSAKQLKDSILPVLYPAISIFKAYPGKIIFATIPFIIMIYNFLNALIRKRSQDLPLILFPLLVLIFYMFKSGWNLWSWYYYMLIPSMLYFFIYTVSNLMLPKKLFKYGSMLFVFAWISINVLIKSPYKSARFQEIKQTIQYLEGKEGIIAMGDAAGIFGYSLENPIIQLEGLVMDFQYLDLIRKGNFEHILKKYNAKYYITITSIEKDGVWHFTEPWKHHEQIINTEFATKAQPIYSSGDKWLSYRIWLVEDLITKKEIDD